MTRWEDEIDYTKYEDFEEEARLVKKLNEYLDLEQSEKLKKEQAAKNSFFKKPNVAIAMVEGVILVGLAAAFMILLNYQ